MPNKFEDNKRLQERCKLTNFVCKKCGRRVMEISKKRESLNAKVKVFMDIIVQSVIKNN